MIALMLTLLMPSAQAATVSGKVCVHFKPMYTDRETGDFWHWPSAPEEPARGVSLVVIDEDTSSVLHTGFSSDGGGDGGCSSVLSFDDTHTFDIRVNSHADVNGIEIKVKPTPSSSTYYQHHETNVAAPAAGGTIDVVITVGTSSTTGWGQLAAATWAFHRNRMGVSTGTVLEMRDHDCCWHSGGIVRAASNRKFVIAHEIGHFVGYQNDETTGASFSYWAAEDGCDGDGKPQGKHGNVIKEYQSAAVVEGFADFFAAWLWNRKTEYDCDFERSYASDFDLNGSDDSDVYSCEGKPVSTLPGWVSSHDWLEDAIVQGAGSCSGTLSNRGTQYDWLRFFWDMLTDESVPPADIAGLYDEMDPKTFDATGSTPLGSDDPVQRLTTACAAMSLSSECAAQDYNGQDH